MRAALILLALLLVTPLAQPLGPDRPCAPGQLVNVSGGGATPGSALLLTWAGRAVGGGVADRSGRYALTLAVGRERPGAYDVAVVTRESREAIQRFRCVVPGAGVPTPAPATPRVAVTPGGAPTATPPQQTPTRPVEDFDILKPDGQVTCEDFRTQPEAQKAYEAGYTDLDGNDRDGLACESLPAQ